MANLPKSKKIWREDAKTLKTIFQTPEIVTDNQTHIHTGLTIVRGATRDCA